ncbi:MULTISPECIES: HNH endonuclease [Acidobacteriaceae]|uniref:HNH endonuclease n=1 Tax=Acidobacteriaceae TaxID=204434 RepID=UPI00131ACE8D|nr:MULTISPECIES: HNH endonuclease [Acidobacteriaceae]MDW5266924.1 HNH endonuclease [Edaphobacter sp.]
MTANERWKTIRQIGEGQRFAVSSLGRVLDLTTGKLHKPTRLSSGLLIVRDRHGEIRKNFTLHRLVAKAFLRGKPTFPVIFKDGDRSNCAVSNLEWAHGDKKIIRYRKLTDADVRYIREQWPGMTQPELAKELSVCRQTISEVVTRKTFDGPKWMVSKSADDSHGLEQA